MTRPDGTDGRPRRAGDTSLPVTNPPGLSEIAYQVSDFTGFRRALLTPLPGEQQLTGWSPGPGDLGLQVLEWWAHLADILTFYNERIANNSYLRTAAGPQGPPVRNVAGLVRLLGYLGRPGTTAQGVLAAIRSPGAAEEDLIVPAGLPITSSPAAGVPAQVFETGGSVRFRGPSDVPIGLPPDDNLFQPADTTPEDAGQPKSVLLAGRATVQPGDQLVLVKQAWDGCTADWALTTVRAATTETGPSGPPNTRVVLDSNDWTGITSTEPQAADYRALKATATALLWTMPAPQARPGLGARAAAAQTPGTPQTPGQTAAVPLATLVRGVAPGDDVLFTGLPTPPAQMLAYVTGYAEDIVAVQPASTDNPPALVPRTTLEVRAVDAGRLASAIANPDEVGSIAMWYGLREAATLIPTPAAALAQLGLTVTVPAGLTLPADGAVALQDATGAGLLVTASRPSPDTVQLSAIGSDPASVNPPLYAPITLLTDLVQVSGGTTVPAEVLGNGDATAASQAFTLQQSPLVYLPAGQPGGPPDSTLNVTVDGVPWSQKPSFYRQPPDATVYVVRSLEDGSTQVRFGDGINGARLPTGVGNVVAAYRYGPAGQPPPPGRLSTVLRPQPNLATMRNPVALTPGTEPEAAAQTAGNAPSSAVLLGAVISPTDCEEAAATVAGVTRVKAYWAWDEGRRCPGITLYVDGDGTVAAVQTQLPLATSRMPIAVKAAQAAGLAITGQLIAGAGADQQAIKKAADAALTDPDTGLFSPGRMGIGQRLYRSQVEAALTVSGVSTVVGLQITRTTSSGSGDRPAAPHPDQPHPDQPHPDQPHPDQPHPDAPSLDPGPDGYFRLLAEALTICVVGHG